MALGEDIFMELNKRLKIFFILIFTPPLPAGRQATPHHYMEREQCPSLRSGEGMG
jgi:hypothetical protein